ncbi:hypothetical protein BYT27DRAFT_7254779 [Phlegmacium glaucopus]|nr:hypothetical protein BYT27DRAFT_7254779 [Phlegmacium glaucopus]
MEPPTTYSNTTAPGRALVRQILSQSKPVAIEPHDYQCEGICRALDGNDVIATMATGAGKTGLLSFLMLVICAISHNPSLALQGCTFPKNPCMLVICPTKALEEDMSSNMAGFGLRTLVINADTMLEGHQNQRNLWIEAQTDPNVILISPEELGSPDCFQLLKDLTFVARVSILGIDELHLLYCGQPIPIMGTSATLREGPPMDSIHAVLGLIPGKYHLIRHSNMRHDIQIICCEMHSGIGGVSFPELDWVLDSDENTVIFCKTISLGFCVTSYLWRCARSKGLKDLSKRIRLFNSLNWPSFNTVTFGFLNNNESSSITVATDVLSVGWDSKYTRDAIILGEPEDVDELAVANPRAFIYYTRTALITAKNVIAQESVKQSPENQPDETMDITMAHFLLAPCKTTILNVLYDNPVEDTPCNCRRCIMDPPTTQPERCQCSGCTPESTTPQPIKQAKPSSRKRVPAAEVITKELQAFGSSELQKLQNQIFFELPNREHNFLPPDAFLSDNKIKIIIDKLYSIKDIPDILAVVGGNPLLDSHHHHLLQQCHILREKFKVLRAEKAAQRKALRQAAAAAVGSTAMTTASDSEEQESETDGDEGAIRLVLESQNNSGELEGWYNVN